MSNSNNRLILIVDDDPISLRLLQGALQKNGHTIMTACHAKEARTKMIEEGIDHFFCVISDYRMPEMTGLELSQWIIKQDPCISVILLSAEADKKMISDSMKSGVFDFLEKPIVLTAIRDAVQKGIQQTISQRSLQNNKDQVDEIQKFHHSILGIHHTKSIEQITFGYFPMHEVGGDFINVYPLSPNLFMVIATDVSGHDLKAAFVSAFFQGVTRGMIEKGASIREIYSFTNQFLLEEWGKQTEGVSMSLATCAAIVDLNQMSCVMTNHGFPTPFYVTDEGKMTPLSEGGSPLGWFADIDPEELHLSCKEGGALYFWSDGIDDTASRMNINTFSALHRFLSSEEGSNQIREQALDDLMVVRFAMNETKQTNPSWLPIFFSENDGSAHIQIDSMQLEWKKSLLFLFPTLSEERLYDILLATREACLNALIHGAKKEMTQKAHLQFSYHEKLQKIRVRIDDPGKGHGLDLSEPMETLEAKLNDLHSGLTMLKFLCQEIRNERNGATVIMDFPMAL